MHSKEEIEMLRRLSDRANEDFREIFEMSEDAICIADPSAGYILKMNGNASLLFPKKHDLSIPYTVAELPGFTKEIFEQKTKAAFNEGPQIFEWEGTVNSRFHRLLITIKPAHISESPKLLIYLRNILSPVQQKQEQAPEQKNKEALIESSTDQIWGVDQRHRLITGNRAFYKNVKDATGIDIKPGDELLISGRAPADYLDFWQGLYSRALQGESFVKEVFRPAINGIKESWREISFHPIYDNDKVTGISCISRDITAQKEAAALQSLLVSIVDSSSDAIYSRNNNDIITSWNKGAEKLFGYSNEEVVGRCLTVIIPEELKNEERSITERISRGEYVEHYETKRRKKDGQIIDVSLTISPVLDVRGNVVGASKTARDITERKRNEEALKNAYEEKNAILESIGDAFFAVDKNWVVNYWNRKAEEMLTIPAEKVLHKNIWEVFPDHVGRISYNKYHRAIETNSITVFENHYTDLNKWFEISAFPSAKGLSVYFKDITDRKLTEMMLTEMNAVLHKQAKDLAVSNAELEQFAYVASHDLQEPLRMVTSFLMQLEKKYYDLVDAKGKQYIGFAVEGAKRMREMILDLLEFSRVGRHDDRQEDVDVNELIGEIRSLFRKSIEEKKAVISTDPLPVIHTYKTPLIRIFQNFISNSLKYVAEGVAPKIHIGVKELPDEYEFSVTDNGIGIDPEYFGKIFIIFQRLHNRSEYSGTGMGLAIAKKITESAGGTIRVESEENKGSCFYFTIKK